MATRRRTTAAADTPAGVLVWFAGQVGVDAAGWHALLPDEEPRLLSWWAAWRAEHPRAVPPADAPWINWSAA